MSRTIIIFCFSREAEAPSFPSINRYSFATGRKRVPYNRLVGGEEKRKQFIPYNVSSAVDNVLLVFLGNEAVGCSGLKKYSDTDAEIKRVWVEPEYRGKQIASTMMKFLEQKAAERGFKRLILQTREKMLRSC